MNRAQWDTASDAERRRWLDGLALPADVRLVGIVQHGARTIAEFERDGVAYVLVPGGEVTIGWDPGSWQPSQAMLDSFADSAEAYGIDGSLADYVAARTSRVARVTVPTLLVERTPREVGWQSVDEADGRRIFADIGVKTQSTLHGPDGTFRATALPDGSVRYETQLELTYHDVLAPRADGFRLPTSAEWEHLCGAGARTLFRWGDHAPDDVGPCDVSPAEREWRRQWALSGGTLARPSEGFAATFDAHRARNAFGLHIAADPYKSELVGELGVTRGGDGGVAVCGGVGNALAWLPLASAYIEAEFCQHDPDDEVDGSYTVSRLVLPLAGG